MKHQNETGALRKVPWPRKVLATVCAVAMALLSIPLGVFHAPEIARAASYSIPADAQASGTSNGCSWYIRSATDAPNPSQLVIYPTDGTSGTLGSFYNESAVPWHSNADAIKTVSIAPGVKTGNTFSYAFSDCSNVTTVDLTNLNTGNAKTFKALFSRCTTLTSVPGLESLDVSNVKDFSYLFYYCKALPNADLSSWDLSAAENMSYLFDSCYSITSIKLPTATASALTEITQMFNGCEILPALDISCLESGQIKSASAVFQGCSKLANLAGYENLVSSTTLDIACIFSGCNSLTSLNLAAWETENIDDFYGLFSNCSSLTTLSGLANWDTSKVKRMWSTFHDVSSLTKIEGITNWDVSNATSFQDVFSDCEALASLDLSGWNTTAGTNFDYAFYGCNHMKVLDIPKFNTSAATSMSGMFSINNRLQQVTLGSKFSFTGNGSASCVLPTPNPAYITGATGKWQAVGSGTVDSPQGTVYLPADVPSNVAETYVVELQKVPTLAARGSWYKATTAKSDITKIKIVDSYTVSGSETESWDASAEQDESVMAYIGADGTTLTIAGNGYGKVYANQNSGSAFSDFSSVTAINGTALLDTSGTTDMSYMFNGCEKLSSIDVSGWDTSSCTTMNSMFYWCKALANLDVGNWNVSKVTNMGYMFAANALTSLDVSDWEVSKVKNMRSLFYGCDFSSIDVSRWDTSSCADMSYLFAYCYNLSSFDVSNWDVSKATTMSHMFTGTSPTAIDMDSWDTSSCKDYEFMFWN